MFFYLHGKIAGVRSLPVPHVYPFAHVRIADVSRSSAKYLCPSKVEIKVQSGDQHLTCEGETIVVNLHGALISTTRGLSVGMRISIHVYLTDKRAKARIVYVDPGNPLRCDVELDQPRNIWGVPPRPATGMSPPNSISTKD